MDIFHNCMNWAYLIGLIGAKMAEISKKKMPTFFMKRTVYLIQSKSLNCWEKFKLFNFFVVYVSPFSLYVFFKKFSGR